MNDKHIIISELSVFFVLTVGIMFFGAHMWDDTPRLAVIGIVVFSLFLGYHTSQFLNRFQTGSLE
jgi:uncharacterized membrane protein